VTLPAGVGWPQLGAAPLFVRPFYEGCFEGVLGALDAGGAAKYRKFTVIGNAGIGKSAFGAYVLWRAVRARRTVVYVSDKVHEAFILHADGRAESFTKAHFDDRTRAVVCDASTVLICDGVTPPIVDAFTLLITSPKRERWKEFAKVAGSRRLFFPVFSRAETGDLLQSCFPHLLGDSGVWDRYAAWGGIPRYVLANIDADAQLLLKSATSRIDVIALFRHLDKGEIESDDAVSHRLVHLKPAGEREDGSFEGARDADAYVLARSELGSPLIIDAVLREAEQRDLDQLRALLAKGHEDATFAKLFGELFERAARASLAAGGRFERFNLSTNAAAGALELAPSAVVSFSNVAALAEEVRARAESGELDASLFAPRSANFTAVDAVLGRGRALVNFTINLSHALLRFNGARTEGVEPVADAMGLGAGVDFYWALPPERFDEACARGREFRVAAAPDGVQGRRITQYAVRVPFERLGGRRVKGG
jgi:hypothetical protein